jgi:DNA-binding SARP family transcriptional activator
MIHLRSLGACEIDVGDTRLLPTARTLFAGALYLAVEGARPIPREQFLELLWPDAADEKANHSLRQMFYRLRAHGIPLDSDASRVVLPAGTVSTDFDALLAPASALPAGELLSRIPGGFLPGYAPRGLSEFAEWVDAQRARVNAMLCAQLLSGLAAPKAAGDWPAVEALAQRCLELDPLNDAATLALAESMAMSGSKARAIMVIDRYVNEAGPRAKALQRPAAALRKRIAELYPLPPVLDGEPPQTGRDAEMAELSAALDDAHAGRGAAIVISGEPGIGKTRLASEFARAAQLRGARIARASMSRNDQRRPLGAWSDLVPTLRRMPGALGCDPESLGYLERLTSPDAPNAGAAPGHAHAEFLFARIRIAILDLVSAVASESCLVLIVEDIHWMDEWSWDVMSVLSRRLGATGALIVMTRRDGHDEATPVPKDALVRGVMLATLDEGACRTLVRSIGGPLPVADEEFLAWCARTSAGNPYFLIELARRASRSDGRFQAPPSLVRLIGERFMEVAPLSRRLLQAAAVLGRNSTLARLESVLGERPVELLDSLDELTRHSLIVADAERLVCRHDLLGSSALSDLSPPSLQLLHRRAAQALDREVSAYSAPALLWDTARHWESAGERERAVALLDRCAERALNVGTPLEAARVLEHALSLLPGGGHRASMQRRRVRALYFAQEHIALIAAAELDRAGAPESSELSIAHGDEELFEMNARLLAVGESARLLEQASKCAAEEGAGPDHRAGAALIGLKTAHALDDAEAATRILRSVSAALPLADPRVATELRLIYEGTWGSVAASAAEARALLALLNGPRHVAARARALLQCAMALHINGDLAESMACVTEALELGNALQMPRAVERATATQYGFAFKNGDLDAAERAMESLDEIDHSKNGVNERADRRDRARFALFRGDFAAARAFLGPIDTIWAGESPREIQYVAEVRARYLMLAEGWVPPAADMARLLRIHRRARKSLSHDPFFLMLVEALEARGERARAAMLAHEYITKHRRERSPLMRQLRELLERLAIPIPEAPHA